MAIRANGLKNFKGQNYATTVDVATEIAKLKQNGKELFLASLLGTGTGSDVNEIAMYTSDGVFQSTGYTVGATSETNFGAANKFATEQGVTAYVAANSAPLISEGNNIFFTDVEGTGANAGKTLKVINAFGYKLVKRETAVEGYAASYDLQISDANGDYATVTGSDPINVVKDQFLKSAFLVWGTSDTLSGNAVVNETNARGEVIVELTNDNIASYTGRTFLISDSASGTFESATIASEDVGKFVKDNATYPFLKLVLYVNTNGSSADDVTTTTVYLPVNELFRDYTAQANASQIQIAISNENVISAAVVAGSITTTELSTGVNASLALADTSIQPADVARILYTAVDGTQTNVKNYLDTLANGMADTNSRAVEFIEVTVTLDGSGITDANGCASTLAGGIVTMTVPGRVVCVYDESGKQIYPDITYNKNTKVSTLAADFGSATADTTWDITYSKTLTVSESSSSSASDTSEEPVEQP